MTNRNSELRTPNSEFSQGFSSRRAQSRVEYVLAIAALVGGLFLIQTYVRLGLQARYKTIVDGAVESVNPSANQYEPYYPSASSTVTTDTERKSTYTAGGTVTVKVDDAAPETEIVDAGARQDIGFDLKADDDWK